MGKCGEGCIAAPPPSPTNGPVEERRQRFGAAAASEAISGQIPATKWVEGRGDPA